MSAAQIPASPPSLEIPTPPTATTYRDEGHDGSPPVQVGCTQFNSHTCPLRFRGRNEPSEWSGAKYEYDPLPPLDHDPVWCATCPDRRQKIK